MKKIVYKIEPDENPEDVYCTTYQMRSFYRQFGSGFFGSLDVMNYMQHHAAVLRMRRGDRILDVCCGRALLLPLIRWHRKNIREYVGVDICEKNISEAYRRSGSVKLEEKGIDFNAYYPFGVSFSVGSCEDMSKRLEPGSFDSIVYTSAIEHMQKEAGARSLEECFTLAKEGGWMFLSCPNTSDKKNPYDTQYAAHLYEWGRTEILGELSRIGWEVEEEYGLVAKVKDFERFVEGLGAEKKDEYLKLARYMPKAWLMAFAPILHPEAAAEVLFICRKPSRRRRNRGFSI